MNISDPATPGLNIQSTADGSVTLHRNDIDEHYHSIKGAVAESRHVYIHLGWQHFAENHSSVKVFEVGFGTGLNAALTAQEALRSRVPTDYYAIELYPISQQLIKNITEYQDAHYRNEFIAVNAAAWGQAAEINPYFTLHKIEGDLLTTPLPEGIDVVYFDAFAPEKQPEMWEKAIFDALYHNITPGGVLTTYCAKGVIRRLLQHTGFTTERLPGPKDGKREVLRATK